MKREVNPPEIFENKCIGCERCVAVCPSFVLGMAEEKAKLLRGEWCIGCDHCGAVCPSDAVIREGEAFEKHPQKGTASAVSPEALDLLFRERRSIRNYKADPVPKEVLDQILDAGRFAPTGTNSQNVNYLVLTTRERIQELRELTLRFYERVFSRVEGPFGRMLLTLVAGRRTVEYLRQSLPKMEVAREAFERGEDRLFYHAPVVMIAHAEAWDSSSSFNCSVALYNCSLKAHSLGLGCCFNGFLVNAVNHDRRIKRWLAIPADHRCYAAMVLGFPKVTYPNLVRRQPPKARWR
ncbi:MAG: nitroreductase family protein [Desulfobacterota bacterium]|nr:nitroreductase family protein [Thermodesulfobacteriota bacterium]